MSKSIIACAIDADECSIARIKTTGRGCFALAGLKTFPFGLRHLCTPRGPKLLSRLERESRSWKERELALSIGHTSYRSLPALFPCNADAGIAEQCCRIEAENFLEEPQRHDWDILDCHTHRGGEPHEEKTILFFSREEATMAIGAFSPHYRITYSGSPLPPFLHLSALSGSPQAMLQLQGEHVLFALADGGRAASISCHPAGKPEDIAYLAISALAACPACQEIPIQVSGKAASRKVVEAIRRETGMQFTAPVIPKAIPVRGMDQHAALRPSTIMALSAGMLALG